MNDRVLRTSNRGVFLDVARMEKLIHLQGLKKYWVAEQAGVHKTTLHRWMSRRIVTVRKHNLERLACVLLTNASDLITTDSKLRAA